MNAKVYTVVVTYNGMQWIEKCLNSILSSTLINEIVIVDNASEDGTLDFIRAYFPSIHSIAQSKNLGFGKANNIGISYALKKEAEFVFLLNQDAHIDSDVFENLISVSVKNKAYGIVSPVHRNWEGSELEYYFSLFSSVNSKFLSDALLKREGSNLYEVPFVNAAAWFIPRNVLETVGGFDPMFKHYGEDNNYCQRLEYHGFKIGFVSNCNIFHDGKIRKEPPNYLFSEAYYLNEIKNLQIEYGDINRDFTSKDLQQIRIHNLKLIVRNMLRFRLKNVIGYIKKYVIFEKEIVRIRNSRMLNQFKGANYL